MTQALLAFEGTQRVRNDVAITYRTNRQGDPFTCLSYELSLALSLSLESQTNFLFFAGVAVSRGDRNNTPPRMSKQSNTSVHTDMQQGVTEGGGEGRRGHTSRRLGQEYAVQHETYYAVVTTTILLRFDARSTAYQRSLRSQ